MGEITMDEGIRSKKSLSLGMPRHPNLLSKNEQTTKLGDAPWHPKLIFKENQENNLGDAPEGIPSFF